MTLSNPKKRKVIKKVLLVFTTDAWHSSSSLELIGVCSTIEKCISLIKSDICRNNYEGFTDDDENCLKMFKQTQGRDTNYDIQSWGVDDSSILVSDIVWDTDGEDAEDLGLPTQVEVPLCVDEDDIADYLSDRYEYCVKSFVL